MRDQQEQLREEPVPSRDSGPFLTKDFRNLSDVREDFLDATAALHEHQRFESLLFELSTQFSGLLEEDIDQAISAGLQRLVEFLDAGRSSFAELTPDGSLNVTHTYSVPGVALYPLGISKDELSWMTGEMRAGRVFVLPQSVEELPPEATAERRIMLESGMKSGVVMPLQVGPSVAYVLCFGVFDAYREWPQPLISRLRVAGEIFANAIARRQAKERLQRKQTELAHLARVVAMSELASVIAHELDQPLTAIISNAQAARHLLARSQPDLGESTAALDDIIDDAIRASEIVHRERRLLRKQQRSVEPLDLNDVIHEIELFIRADARQHGAQVKMTLSRHLAKVIGERVQLQQVLLNLTRNGIQAMSSQPRKTRLLCIATTSVDHEIRIEVKDAGPAIDDGQFNQMFEPFFTTKSDGLGMGLSISRSIIQAHRGRMWATRNSTGGMTMHVALPAPPTPPAPAEVHHGK